MLSANEVFWFINDLFKACVKGIKTVILRPFSNTVKLALWLKRSSLEPQTWVRIPQRTGRAVFDHRPRGGGVGGFYPNCRAGGRTGGREAARPVRGGRKAGPRTATKEKATAFIH